MPIVTKTELEVADVDAEDFFVSAILEDRSLKTDLRLAKEDEETFKTMKRMWEERGDRLVFFSILKAIGQEKYISGRYKD